MRLAPPTPAARAAFACALAVCALSSCKSFRSTHRAEKKTVDEFATALADADAEALHALSSSGFQGVALKDEAAIDEFKRLWPVTGKLEVVKVKDVPPDDLRDPDVREKIVTVKDDRGSKSDYRLVENRGEKKWVVDEILVTQTLKGVKSTKTITEQVEFVRFVRDFSEAWRSGDRERRLAGVTPECRAELEPLPDDTLGRLAEKMFPGEEGSALPEATMDDDVAYVSLRRPTGSVVLMLKRVDGDWLVDDAELQAGRDGEQIPSLRKTAVAHAAATKFLAAYSAADPDGLQATATPTFYGATLKSADLSDVPLPAPAAGEAGKLTLVGDRAELVVEEPDRVVKLALIRTDAPDDAKALTEYRVEDVTLYEQEGRLKRRLASALVAEPIAQLYADALLARDLTRLKVMASFDFNERVWKRLPGGTSDGLPLDELRPGDREIISTVHKGTITEVTMLQAGVAMTCVLKDEGGEVRVDDVLTAAPDRPSSLKTTLVHLLPVIRLQAALAAGDVPAIRQDCSSDFNRLIWSQVREVPPDALAAARFLEGPLSSLEVGGTEATVRLGRPDLGGVVTLIEHHGAWKVHDVMIVAGPRPEDQAALKPWLRDGLANGTLFAGSRPRPESQAIEQVGYEVTAPPAEPTPPADAPPAPLIAPPSQPTPEAETRPIISSEAAAPGTDDAALPFSEPLR